MLFFHAPLCIHLLLDLTSRHSSFFFFSSFFSVPWISLPRCSSSLPPPSIPLSSLTSILPPSLSLSPFASSSSPSCRWEGYTPVFPLFFSVYLSRLPFYHSVFPFFPYESILLRTFSWPCLQIASVATGEVRPVPYLRIFQRRFNLRTDAPHFITTCSIDLTCVITYFEISDPFLVWFKYFDYK